MTTDVAVVMAWRDLGCLHRRAAYAYTHDWWSQFGWPIVVEGEVEPFTRARALNAAVARAADLAPVIVQADPDSVLAEPNRVDEAVELTRYGGLVVAHDRYLYLTEQATTAVYNGRRLETLRPADCESHGRGGVGNVTVFTVATWWAAGGYDERFGLRAGDDAAFAYAVEAFCEPTRRTPGDMIHMFHPRLAEFEPGGERYSEQFALLAAYRDASTVGRHAVRRLVHTRGS
jgi:hypothetical protein